MPFAALLSLYYPFMPWRTIYYVMNEPLEPQKGWLRENSARAGTTKLIIPYDQIQVVSMGAPKNYKEKFRDPGTI
jgi:hypothetical protein